MCLRAVENDESLVLGWARKKGFPWNENVSLTAARLGHASTFMMAIEGGCPWNRSECLKAADDVAKHVPHGSLYDRSGHVRVRNWIRRRT